ncbi:MAG: hypothetical protein JW751_29035 [Polyangiaceae bacterium]|nr:hypothetical protein [Polyangiaceae bacterium]
MLLQGARGCGAEPDLLQTLGSGEDYIDGLVATADIRFEFVHLPLRAERLFFPEGGLVALPLSGSEVAIAVPLHPSFMEVAVPRTCPGGMRQLETLCGDEDNITSLSAGLDVVRRVVIPGSVFGKHDEKTMRAAI